MNANSAKSLKKMSSYQTRDGKQVQGIFSKIASRYDLANGVLSFQLHKIWNQKLANSLNGSTLLDLCSGTGEIAYRWLNTQKGPKSAVLLDFCPEMLDIAKEKRGSHEAKGHKLSFIEADAAKIPLANSSVDAVSVAYGVRNICDLPSCFSEVHRVLNPGGTFAILELTAPNNRLLRSLHTFYLNRILPTLGGILTREKDAYAYLSRSIQEFVEPQKIAASLKEKGFDRVTIKPLFGGIATLITAQK